MAADSLIGQFVSSTFQRLLQLSNNGSYITDGTGSIVYTLPVTASYALSAGSSLPADLSSLVTTSSFNTFTSSYYLDSASFASKLNNVSVNTSSLITVNTFNTFTSSYYLDSSSFASKINNITFDSSSLATKLELNTFTSSIQTQVNNLNSSTASYVMSSVTASMLLPYTLNSATASMLTPYVLNSVTSSMSVATASFAFTSQTAVSAQTATIANSVSTLNQDVTIAGSLTINQNLIVYGSASINYVTSSQLNIGTNIITVNTSTPAVRFGGLSVIDSGSNPQVSGSILFDSVKNQWLFIHQNSVGAVTSSVFIQGPQTFNNVGNETQLTTNRLVKSVVGNQGDHIGNSNISDSGTIVSINSNTEITGSLQITAGVTASLFGTASFTSPRGPAYSVQFNDAGITSGSSYFTYDKSMFQMYFTGAMNVNGNINLSGGSINATSISGSYIGNGSGLTNIIASTASYVNTLNQNVFVNGNLAVSAGVISAATASIGDPIAPALIASKKNTVGTNSVVLYTTSTSSYDSIHIDYNIKSGSNGRAGLISAMWLGASADFSDVRMANFGTTTGFTFGAIVTGSNLAVTGIATSAGWTVKTIIRSI